MQKRWSVKEMPGEEAVKKLSTELNIDDVLSTLLLHRGITSLDEARYFFRPDINHLHDPFLMQDMEKAVLRIEQAFANGEKVMIYGDYDVDGTTSVALVYSFFKKYYDRLDYY